MKNKRPAKKYKYNKKRLAVMLLLACSIPFLVKIFILTIPVVGAAAEKAAIVSFGFSFPEGALGFIGNTAPESSELSEDEQEAHPENEPESETESELEMDYTGIIGAVGEQYEPTAKTNNGVILRETFRPSNNTNSINIAGNAYIHNITSLKSEDIKAAALKKPDFEFQITDEPLVLLYHTHATESFEDQTRDFYDNSYTSRTTDNTKNIVRVGDEIVKQLMLAGIPVIHDTALHDYPSYNGSYDNSREMIQKTLVEYPSIKFVIDVHRDAIQRANGDRVAPVAEINGKNAAQIMIISGCDDGTMNYPNYFKNLGFSSLVQQQLSEDYENFARPLLFSYRKYNQDIIPGSFLLEVGANGNSLDEAIYAGELFGKSFANVIKNMAS